MAVQSTKKGTKVIFNECELTGVFFDGQFSPLRLWLSSDKLHFDLSFKAKTNAIFIDTDATLLNKLINNKVSLPSEFQCKVPENLKEQICCLYEKKFFNALSFMLKAKQAVIGRRAIDRALSGLTEITPFAVLLTENGSEAICDSFKFKQQNLKIIKNFSQETLQKITGREKISYYCILDTEMGRLFVNDYMKYLQIIKH